MLDNLIENALVYSPGGTRVLLSWDGEGRLVVLDEGSGIAPGDEVRLFERFGRGRSDRRNRARARDRRDARPALGRVSVDHNRDGGGARAEVGFPLFPRSSRPVAQVIS